ncbi:hypothetical protein PIB30_055432 [Stylosanthes scabra]|uniref:Uncharacterized protein n=1 Tax=Stylosanthes scabra TaxID=79078 RepID=A0ABU6RJD5_9FABA|nr:hypothetical protein [Stylosanthes scabra]
MDAPVPSSLTLQLQRVSALLSGSDSDIASHFSLFLPFPLLQSLFLHLPFELLVCINTVLNLEFKYDAAGSWETSFSSTRFSLLSPIFEEGEASHKSFGRAFAFSTSPLKTLDNDSLEFEETKVQVKQQERYPSSVTKIIDNAEISSGDEMASIYTKFQSIKATHFCVLMENVAVLEETFVDSEALRLERDITSLLEKLGVLDLFNRCLSRSLESSYVQDYTGRHRGRVEEHMKSHKVNDYVGKVFVQSSKKTEKKTRTKRAQRALVAKEGSCRSLDSKANLEGRFYFSNSSLKRASSTKNRKLMITRREAEISKVVKVLAELERTRKAIEKDTNQVASLRSWAEASGVDKNVLLQQLHYGRYCQDELIRSIRSLVLYLSRKYRGLGIASKDSLQVLPLS